MVTTRFYYTLNDMQDPTAALDTFATLINYWLGASSFTDGTNTGELYNRVSDEYGNEFMFYVDVQHEPWEEISKPTIAEIKADDDMLAEAQGVIKSIRHWLNDSQFHYDKIISLFNSNSSDLMKQLESTVQFNDTPQTTNTGLSGDTYATNYTVNKADAGTVMQRLNEVRDSYTSLYIDWVHEFGKKFVVYNF